ncbi:MAG: FtsB family cell division protein, partial [Thermoleophilia bacterium]
TAFGVARSVGPLSEFREARSERADLEAQVALLVQENEAVGSENDRLDHDTYLEALARSELNLARPGEDVFIVTGLPTTTTATTPDPVPVEPGPLEKMVSSLRRLF